MTIDYQEKNYNDEKYFNFILFYNLVIEYL